MTMQMNLDARWIDEAMADRSSGASTVIAVQTSDPERSRQLTSRLAALFPSAFYQFRPWAGLETWKQKEQCFARVEAPQPSDESEARDDLRDLGAALRHMDKIMRAERAGKTAFVLRDLDKTTDSDTRNAILVDALRFWATDNRVLAKESVICLLATDPATVLDRGTLESVILASPEVASDSERLSLVQGFVADARVRLDNNVIHALASAARGLNLHQAGVVLRKSWAPDQKLTIEDVKHHKADYIRRSDVLEIEEPTVSFQDVGGYEPVKGMVRQTLISPLNDAERVKTAALPLPRGLLLFGPGGTGKTLFAKSLARETNLPFINLKTEDIFSQYLGVSGQRLRDAIRMAEAAAPAIVFVDEIDRFGSRSGSGTDGASQETQRVFSQMLEWLGNADRKSIIVGTTNVPHHLDPVFVRPGRFSACIPFLYPDRVAREQILSIHLGLARAGDPRRPDMDERDVRKAIPAIAAETEFYAGCDLEELVIRAKQRFFNDKGSRAMTGCHLLSAHKDYRIDVESRRETETQYRELGGVFASSVDMLRSLGGSAQK
jgi:AAA+ superfamily predicted ATPase